MIIKEEINTKDNTKFIFDLGDIVLRNDVRYDQDVRECFEYFLKQNILQNPIKNIELSMVYEFDIRDELAFTDDYFQKKTEGFDDDYILNPMSRIAIKFPFIKSHNDSITFDINIWLGFDLRAQFQPYTSNFFKDINLNEFKNILFKAGKVELYYVDTPFAQRYINPEWLTPEDNDFFLDNFFAEDHYIKYNTNDIFDVFFKFCNNDNFLWAEFLGEWDSIAGNLTYDSIFLHIKSNQIADALIQINNNNVSVVKREADQVPHYVREFANEKKGTNYCMQKGDKYIFIGDNAGPEAKSHQEAIAECINEEIKLKKKNV